jgi:hypothetical protein
MEFSGAAFGIGAPAEVGLIAEGHELHELVVPVIEITL